MQQSFRTHSKWLIFSACVIRLLISVPAEAMHCGSKVIRKGDSAEKVRKYCGEPTNIERRIIYRTPVVTSSSALRLERSTVAGSTATLGRRASEEVWLETWTYGFGN